MWQGGSELSTALSATRQDALRAWPPSGLHRLTRRGIVPRMRSTLKASLVVLGCTAIAVDALAQGGAPPPASPPTGAQPPAAQKPAAKPDDKKKADEKKPAQTQPSQGGASQPGGAPPSGEQPSGDQPAGAAPAPAAAPGDGTTGATTAPPPSESPPPSPSVVSEAPTLPGNKAAATPPPGFTAATATATPAAIDSGEKGEEEKRPPPEMTIAPELFAGLNARLGGASEGFRNEDSAGMTFGLGGWFAPARLWSIGLKYQRTVLGAGETPPGDDSVSAHYNLNTIWLGGRAYPLRNDKVGLFVALQLGASWQDVSANGTRATGAFTTPAASFSCSGSDGPGLALGGGLGVDVDIDRNFAFIAQLEASGHQLTSDPVDGCVAGSGSATNLGTTVGFQYRFDLDQNSAPATAAAKHRTPSL